MQDWAQHAQQERVGAQAGSGSPAQWMKKEIRPKRKFETWPIASCVLFEFLCRKKMRMWFRCVSIFSRQSHIAMIHSELANENSKDLLEKNLPVAQTLLFGQSANLVHSFSACHGKKNEVYTNWHIRLFNAL